MIIVEPQPDPTKKRKKKKKEKRKGKEKKRNSVKIESLTTNSSRYSRIIIM